MAPDAHDRTPLFLDDLQVGQRFISRSHVVDEAQILKFAREFDPQPFHLDHEAGRRSLFGGLVASGWHTAAITMRLVVEGGIPLSGGHLGVGGEISWPNPTRPGDSLHVTTEVIAVVPSRSRPDRGIATIRTETLNQRGEVAQLFTARVVVPTRPMAL
jgi:acyl dehydratase